MFELCGILFLDLYSKTEMQPKRKTGYIAKRKQEYNDFRKRVENAQLKRAEKMVLANDIYMYKKGKPLFDSDLKRLRKVLGNKGCDSILERIENVNPVSFDEVINI